MADLLLRLGENVYARRVIGRLGLPIPMPQALRRAGGPWSEAELAARKLVFGGEGALLAHVRATVAAAGGAEVLPTAANHRNAREGDAAAKIDGLVFDATAISSPDGLRALYDFFHPKLPQLVASGRVLVLGTTPSKVATASEAAAQQALDGFVRSLARELGKRGATANLVYVDPGAEPHLAGTARFLLSDRSAFVSGQPLHVSNALGAPGAGRWERTLAGKVALVTGAARGIGAATARALAAEGAHVVCLDRPADGELAEEVARGIGGSTLRVDVASDDAPARIAAELKARHGGVDILVHNAGVTRDKTLARMKPDQWDQALTINLAALTRITDALVTDEVLRARGRVVCLSSIAGIAGNLGQTNYAASKAGVIGLVRALAPTLASRAIAINAVAPGFIETRLTEAVPVFIREVGRRLSNLGQGGLPEDVADAVTFLATPGASGLTGEVLRVCGGAYVGA